ncbi:MAG: Mor transcription activator family protein [Eubacterium sp.]
MSEEHKIRLQDLYGVQKDIAEVIGVDNYIKLSLNFGGDNIYIQKYSELIKVKRNAEIREKFNGYNSDVLAKEYDLSERYVRILCADIIDDIRSRPPEGQLTLWD